MKTLLLFTLFSFSCYSQSLVVTNNLTRAVTLELGSMAVAGSCATYITGLNITVPASTSTPFYTTHSAITASNLTVNGSSTITPATADATYGAPNWEFTKFSFRIGTTTYSGHVGNGTCNPSSWTWSGGAFNVLWNEDFYGNVSIIFY
ncbi:MAG TPA: hypothetical protein VF676_06180 [Flavobacterium sp.]